MANLIYDYQEGKLYIIITILIFSGVVLCNPHIPKNQQKERKPYIERGKLL